MINVDIQVARDDTPSSLAKARLTKNDRVKYAQRVATNIPVALSTRSDVRYNDAPKVSECHARFTYSLLTCVPNWLRSQTKRLNHLQ